MPVYSHSQLSTFEKCPLQYKLSYIDKIKRETEGIEAFLGSRVHEVLQKCYHDAHYTRVNTLEELLAYYENRWQANWHNDVVIVNRELTADHFRALGRKMLETYYRHYAPFNADITIGTERMVSFNLDGEGKYKMRGIIDRLGRTADGTHVIHDYKTSASLPSQEYADSDRQLALYHFGVRQTWPDVKDIRLVWHYLAFDRELVSSRTDEAMADIITKTIKVIDDIESAAEFPPVESSLCEWCEYPDLCPKRKHYVFVEKLPENEYLKEPGVVLVNKFTELKDRAALLDIEMEKVREAIIQYAKNNRLTAIKGTTGAANIKFDRKMKFPGKNDTGREGLENIITGAGKWEEVSQLDTTALSHAVQGGKWDKDLIRQVLKFGKIEETATVYLTRFKGQ